MASSLHLSSEHQHLCAKGKSQRPSRTLHPHTPLTLNTLQQTGVRKGLTKLPFTHICHLQFTKLHEAMLLTVDDSQSGQKSKPPLVQSNVSTYHGKVLDWRTDGMEETMQDWMTARPDDCRTKTY